MIWIALAAAQEPLPLPIDMERYRPVADTHGYVNVESASTLEHLQVAFGLHVNQSDDPVVLLDEGRRVLGPAPTFADGLISLRTRADLQVAVGLRGRFAFGIGLPVTLWQEGFEPSAPGPEVGPVEPVPSGLGDVRVMGKGVIVPQSDSRQIGVSFQTTLTAPTGSRRSFLGEGTTTVSPSVTVEWSDDPVHDRAHRVRAAVQLGGHFKGADTFRGVSFGSAFTWATAVGVRPFPALEVGVEAVGLHAGAERARSPIELLPHVRFSPLDVAHITAGAGWGVRAGVGAPDRRVFIGLALAPRFDPLALDRDGDGIPNKYDQCPSVPEDLDGYGDADGCPESDNDGDGILDEVDRCPELAEDRDGVADADGCPDLDDDNDRIPEPLDLCPTVPEDLDGFRDNDGCPEADNDGDGILDPVDQCPMAPEVINGFNDTDGCPDSKQYLDADADGLVDESDACPAVPEDADGFEDGDGCPEPDNDADGLPDPVDACPNEPETMNGFEDADGCPDVQPMVVVGASRLDLGDRVFFEVDRAVIRDVSYPLLDEVARVILANPNLQQFRIEGHTDRDGGNYYNLRLSQVRARAVKAYLVKRGVEPGRLEAVGFGESRPIADNGTEAGRAANRRVEFVIVRSTGR